MTQGGSQNLFKVDRSSELTVYRVNVGRFSDSKTKIGSARNLENALSIIKLYACQQIKEIREW